MLVWIHCPSPSTTYPNIFQYVLKNEAGLRTLPHPSLNIKIWQILSCPVRWKARAPNSTAPNSNVIYRMLTQYPLLLLKNILRKLHHELYQTLSRKFLHQSRPVIKYASTLYAWFNVEHRSLSPRTTSSTWRLTAFTTGIGAGSISSSISTLNFLISSPAPRSELDRFRLPPLPAPSGFSKVSTDLRWIPH